MCRMVVFCGSCTRCQESFTWDSLSQHLACLEAKNNDAFGSCSKGVYMEQHNFDQECDRCAEEDEGVWDVDDEQAEMAVTGKRTERDEKDGYDARQHTAGSSSKSGHSKKQKT